MILALLVVLALAETFRRTRHRMRALWPHLRRDLGELTQSFVVSVRRVALAEWLAIAAITLLAIVVRWAPLSQPIRNDEAARIAETCGAGWHAQRARAEWRRAGGRARARKAHSG